MGVINITPDSFSDGGQAFERSLFEEKFLKLVSTVDCIDIGAESTAPKNSAISGNEEISRWREIALPFLKKYEGELILSVDTYKIETMEVIAKELSDRKNIKLSWNDVSGDLTGALNFLKSWPAISYVCSHNLAPKRELAARHMEYVQQDFSVEKYFIEKLEQWKKSGLSNELIFDPCFGFSKTAEQNNELIKLFPELVKLHGSWLVGISKKSFLRKVVGADAEQLHCLAIYTWMKEMKHSSKVMIRLHDPTVFKTAEYFLRELYPR